MNATTEKPFAAGGCRCGAVQVTAAAAPLRMIQCHCRDCRQYSGAGHAANAMFRAEDVSISGETKSYTVAADSGNQVTRHFCGVCGNRVYHTNTGRGGIKTLPVGILQHNDWFAPQMILYTRHRPGWDATSREVPNFDAMPPA